MRFTYAQHFPYRHFGDDFEEQAAEAVVSTPYFGLVDPQSAHADLRAGFEELIHAARAGFDAVALTEHGQSAYDMSPNPDLGAAIMAHAFVSEGLECGIWVVGRSLGKTREPFRVAEELAWLDTLSEGRLMTGFPVGLPYDANINAGIPPIETRPRFDENLSFILKAWTAHEPFAWNGKFAQYGNVNVWPRAYQAPHPPVSITGTGNPNTSRFALQRDFGFNLTTTGGDPSAAPRIFGDFWRIADEVGADDNPFRANFVQQVLVADTDAEAERLYSQHVAYSVRRGIGTVGIERLLLPGGISPPGLRALLGGVNGGAAGPSEPPTYGELVESGAIVAGSAATVRDRLEDMATRLRVGNMTVFLMIGSMPTELTKANIDLFTTKVIPPLRSLWSEYESGNRWWPARLGGRSTSHTNSEMAGAHLV
ncbi:LLM class flavin-dependent oxidoreductase [Mycobacterium sp. 236(2023)]|uniref:LLM class flavin-dependent oxidoreductase n=1 Tax=Mycobacterium sp. 236(2023) TaxID=3038163 RepID=UPI002414DACA|nr:LLM class flavin-dependent oxidoreductase [Mycobacterium sp. 236(2023)]MDG4668115.1 LLM class flavin-dependent oxidoreductase [Mycobacterium sp. 236(2023)]